MKKLIALILILVITSFIVVSKDGVSLSQRLDPRVSTGKREHSNPKNKNWEYVKDRLFDSESEKVYRIEGPILLTLNNASKQDSLAVGEIMKELRIILPNKTIAFFDDFTGVSYQNLTNTFINTRKDTVLVDLTKVAKKTSGFSLWELKNNTIKLNFLVGEIPMNSLSRIGDDNEIGRSTFIKGESIYNGNMIVFSFNKLIQYERRKRNIRYEILRTLCYINPSQFFPFGEECGVFETPEYVSDQAKFNEQDKFLLKKLYSDDFIEQFKDYMYANYPWRYASSFVNKKEHEFKAFGIVVSVGILAFVLMFSYFQNRKYKYSYLNYLFPTFFIFIHFINLDNIYNYLTSFNSIATWVNSILFQLVLSLLIAPLISFKLWSLEKISIKGNESFSYQLVLKVAYTFIAFLVPIIVLFMIESDREGLFDFLFPYLLFVLGLAIGRGLLLYLNHFSESLVKEKDVELSRLREAKSEAEVKMLQSQINPHFLYNALNSIASLAHTDANKTEKMALSLSDLFRHSINQKEKKVNTLGDEIYLVRNYLEIEQIRFGDRLSFNIDVESDLLTVEIPMFILQPLVENAIKHGISKIEGKGEIVLKVTKKDNGILISVQDNGPDFPEGLVSGHGLQTVYDLLRFSYGDKAEMSWNNQPQKEITIQINNMI